MLNVKNPSVAVFADRIGHQWIVRDPSGDFWILPQSENPWDDRQPFVLEPEAELEPLPRHYSSLFRLPFH